MRVYEAKRLDRAEAETLLVKPAPDLEPTAGLHAPARIIDADTGADVAILARYPGDMGLARHAFAAYPMSTTKRTAGIRNRSAVFGYVSRRVHMKREGCRACNGASEQPRAHEGIVRIGETIAAALAEADPDRMTADRATASTVNPGWLMRGTPWTSGVLNETSPLPYHYDRNNMPTWSAMLVARRHTRGGHLHIPEYGLVLECRDGDIVWFPGWKFVHGVTPISKTDPTGYRYTAVWYTVTGMQDCLAPAEETARARRTRSEREDTLLDRQAELGLLDR